MPTTQTITENFEGGAAGAKMTSANSIFNYSVPTGTSSGGWYNPAFIFTSAISRSGKGVIGEVTPSGTGLVSTSPSAYFVPGSITGPAPATISQFYEYYITALPGLLETWPTYDDFYAYVSTVASPLTPEAWFAANYDSSFPGGVATYPGNIASGEFWFCLHQVSDETGSLSVSGGLISDALAAHLDLSTGAYTFGLVGSSPTYIALDLDAWYRITLAAAPSGYMDLNLYNSSGGLIQTSPDAGAVGQLYPGRWRQNDGTAWRVAFDSVQFVVQYPDVWEPSDDGGTVTAVRDTVRRRFA